MHYGNGSEAQVEAEYHSCDSARSKNHFWEANENLQRALEAILLSR
jgi:hypothetical protein